MTSHHILFTRPLALRFVGLPALRVDGQLEGYVAGDAYEGRLQIVNNIGDCTVEWLSGTMPPGTTVRVDNSTSEVVVAWPSYQVPDPNTTVVPNGSFEDGDVQWSKGAGWLIGSGSGFDTYDGTHSAAYTGRGIASLEGTKVPVIVGTSITASVQIQQGASSKGNVVARILLIWYDAYGVMLPGGEGHSWNGGNLVRSGSNGAWHASTVTASAPAGAFYVALAVSANRKRQNRRLWADKAVWNHSYPTGQNSDDDYCMVLRVRDSAGREAPWEGCVGEQAIYLTTQPYPYFEFESIMAQMPGVYLARLGLPPVFDDGVSAAMAPLAGEIRNTQSAITLPPEDFVTASMDANSGTLRDIQRTYDYGTESVQTIMAATSGTLKTVLITHTIAAENIRTTMAPTSGTLA